MIRYEEDIYNSNCLDDNDKAYIKNNDILDCYYYCEGHDYTEMTNIAGSRDKSITNVCEFKSQMKPNDEKVICRCIYKLSKDNSNCKNCELYNSMKMYTLDNKFNIEVLDYELPTCRGTKRNIDIILKYDNVVYFTEVKPVDNPESLLRMCFEIITYSNVINHWFDKNNEVLKLYFENKFKIDDIKKYNKAILFFEGSKQEKIFNDPNAEIYTKRIIRDENITVFCAKIIEDKLQIEKVN